MVYQPPSLGEEGRGRQPAGEKGREASSGALSSCVILTGNEAVSRYGRSPLVCLCLYVHCMCVEGDVSCVLRVMCHVC